MSDIGIVIIMGAFLIWITNKADTVFHKVELREALVSVEVEKVDLQLELQELRKANQELAKQVDQYKIEVGKFEKLVEDWVK